MRTDGQDPADSIAASYTVDMADQVDRLEDVVKERLMELRRQNPGVDEAKLLAQIVEEQVKTAGDSPMLRTKRDDTLDEALLSFINSLLVANLSLNLPIETSDERKAPTKKFKDSPKTSYIFTKFSCFKVCLLS